MLVGLIVFIGAPSETCGRRSTGRRDRPAHRQRGRAPRAFDVAVEVEAWDEGGPARGASGTGKTTLVNLLAKESGMNLVDLNASDVRTKDKLQKRMGEAMSTISLLGERSLIFLDEVDGLAGGRTTAPSSSSRTR